MKKNSTKKNTKKNKNAKGAKYTRIRSCKVADIIQDAADGGFRDIDLAERVREEAEIYEDVDNPGTWFISFTAKTWREAAAFNAAIIGTAFVHGCYADVSMGWETGLDAVDSGRLVDVFVSSADFMTDDGKPVVG